MRLYFLDFLSAQLVFLPFYLLILSTIFFVHFFVRKNIKNTGILAHADHVPVYDTGFISNLALPIILVFISIIFSIRSYETFFCNSQFLLTAQAVKSFYLIFFFFFFNFFFIQQCFIKTTQSYMLELFVIILWLLWSYFWLLLSTNLITYLFFFEVLGLLLLLGFLYTYLTHSHVAGLYKKTGKLLNSRYNNKLLVIQTLIFFLWTSGLSMLLIFWSSILLLDVSGSYEISFAELFYIFFHPASYAQYSSIIHIRLFSLILLLALLLKTAIIPLNAWLLVFYKHMPLAGLFFYMQYYYIFFLLVFTNLISCYLFIFIPYWILATVLLLPLVVMAAITSVNEVHTLRGLFAFSSVVNITLILALAISCFN